MTELADRTVIVTGAATGIGAAVAAAFADRGAKVYGVDDAWVGATDERVARISCDVASEKEVAAMVGRVVAESGRVDVLINNAAMSSAVLQKPFEEITQDEWTTVMSNNTLAPFLCTKAVVPTMRGQEQRGRIVNLTSSTVFLGVPDVLHYVSSKGAILVMTRGLARELGADGITVNAVAPGLTMTEGMLANPTWTTGIRDAVAAGRCLPREERAEDLVGACLFLASDGAAFITGQTLTVDGGNAFH